MNRIHTLLITGLVVALGAATFAMTHGLTQIKGWPLYIAVPGFFSLITAFTARNNVARLLFSIFGLLLFLLGCFFMLFSFGAISWEKTSTLWPAFLVIAGVSEFFAYFIGHGKAKPLLFTSVGLIAGGAVILAFLV